MKKTDSFVNNTAVRRLILRSTLGARQKSLGRATVRSRRASSLSKSPVKKSPPKRSAQFIKNTLIPNHNNNYRPHLVRRVGLMLIATFLVVLNLSYFYIEDRRVLGGQTDITIAALFAETNVARAKSNLPPLIVSDKLAAAAQSKAEDMLRTDYWAHTSPTGQTPWDFIAQSGYNYVYAGENLARGFTSTDAILRAWLASPTHRANVLGERYVDVGFAVVEGKMDGQDTILVVAEYGRLSNKSLIDAPNAGGQVTGMMTSVGMTETPSFWTRLVDGARNLTPSLIFTLAVLGLVTAVTVIAHFAHWRLSPRLAKTWRLHHALIKVCFVAVLTVGAILSYGGGMI
ncbi:CAP domain-containing protein [Candidatus Saccharibacteria bacterium]|nr:CAP domain-containing protein [Candidatus Saccharibacteria bacterium]